MCLKASFLKHFLVTHVEKETLCPEFLLSIHEQTDAKRSAIALVPTGSNSKIYSSEKKTEIQRRTPKLCCNFTYIIKYI